MLAHAYLTHCEHASLDFAWRVGKSGDFQHVLGEHGKRDMNFVEYWKTRWIHGPFFAGIIHGRAIQAKNMN